jgi:dienelactone hydrolase
MQERILDYADGDLALHGFLATPDSGHAGSRPLVLVVHEITGIQDHAKRRARMLAELGYVALAVDMYGRAVDPSEIPELVRVFSETPGLLRRRVKAGLEAALRVPGVDAARVAAIGYCFGGKVALELARDGAALEGVVSFHGTLDTQEGVAAGGVRAKLLICHGADDPFVPPGMVETFQAEMRENGVDYQLVSYGGAQHAFTNRDVAGLNMPGIAYNEDADGRSWAAMRYFLREVFGEAEKGTN